MPSFAEAIVRVNHRYIAGLVEQSGETLEQVHQRFFADGFELCEDDMVRPKHHDGLLITHSTAREAPYHLCPRCGKTWEVEK